MAFQAVVVAAFGMELEDMYREQDEILEMSRICFELNENRTPMVHFLQKLTST